jgi:serine protein kinase
MTSKLSIEDLLVESEREAGRFAWNGSFAQYLRMVSENPAVARLSHHLLYDAIVAEGVHESATGERVYGLFEGKIFGVNAALDKIVQYFASSARRFEIRKRILLFLGPPASGKSSIVALMKQALERYTRTDAGAVYTIKGCPMQEDPLHLIPPALRSALFVDYGVYVEGDLCPRCRYVLRNEYQGKISEMPVSRVVFSEREAVGIGYYIATNPNPSDASLLVGSIDTTQLDGDRLEVAGKAFRLDGELNVSNRGLMEFVEIFKSDRHLLTTLLGLAQEQLIKMDRFGSVYADEVIVAHSNDGDFSLFLSDEHSEALKDRIIAIQIPYNRRVADEVKIYQMMLEGGGLENVHIPPLTLPVMSIFAVLTRLEQPEKQGASLLDKLRLYDGQDVRGYSKSDVEEMRRHSPNEGMGGLSPRYVMNQLSRVASSPGITCVTPLKALDSLWQGIRENVSLNEEDIAEYIGHLKDAVEEYSQRAIVEVKKAFDERFEQTASELLTDYLANVATFVEEQGTDGRATRVGGSAIERSMREMEKHIGVADRDRSEFRQGISQFFADLSSRGFSYDYTSEPSLRRSIEESLFKDNRRVEKALSQPRLARHQADWRRRRGAIYNRLIDSSGYCPLCANDIIEHAIWVLQGKAVLKSPKNEGVEWMTDLDPSPLEPAPEVE